jgi:hypothetical protein
MDAATRQNKRDKIQGQIDDLNKRMEEGWNYMNTKQDEANAM